MRYASITHKGNVRTTNEDSFYIPEQGHKGCAENLTAVADGMGGHSAGEVASSIAIQSIVSDMDKCMVTRLSNPDELLIDSIRAANDKIWILARDEKKFYGMGTTMTAAFCFPDKVVVGHIGDTRAYLMTPLGLEQVTEDHTLVQEMVNAGVITPEETAHHVQRHIITRALGVRSAEDPDIYTRAWTKNDMLILCSDGLSEHVTPEEIIGICWNRDDLEAINQELVDLALERGGTDNITICLVLNDEEETPA